MASKYDLYWLGRLEAIDDAVQLAAKGIPATVDVQGLRSLGARQSWYGTVEIRGGEATGASMAHAVSLGRIVAASGVCAPWPERTFRLTVTRAGALVIVMAGTAVRGRVARAPYRDRHSEIASAACVDAADRREDGGPLDPATGCARVHTALAALPPWRQPAEVPFTNGLYFFYEQDEYSPHAPGGRVVRIGNHPRAQDRLVGRLEDHFNSRPRAKNFSVFRRYLGGALLRHEDANGPCLQPAPGQGHWEKQDSKTCPRCAGVERAVSELLSSAFTFRCVRVDDRAERNNFEKWLIATIAACPVCRPSDSWLGRYAYPDLVRSSGLWNVQYVGEQPATGRQLRRFEELIGVTSRDAGPEKQLDLSHTMLVIPCSGGKDGVADPGLPQVSVADLLGTAERKLLEQGRQLAFDRRGTILNLSSSLRPALAYYTGQPYATEGVRAALVEAIRRGMQCLIISAGYGVLRAEEPIYRYSAQMAQTRSVWAQRLPAILADYVCRQDIDRSFVLLSRQYAACVPQLTQTEQRMVPTFTRGRDPGSAIREVPARIGSELSRLLPALLRGSADTRDSGRQ
jgi:hypothetical protein